MGERRLEGGWGLRGGGVGRGGQWVGVNGKCGKHLGASLLKVALNIL